MIPLPFPPFHLLLPGTPFFQPSIQRPPDHIPPRRVLPSDPVASQPCLALSLLMLLSLPLTALLVGPKSSSLLTLISCSLLIRVGSVVAASATTHDCCEAGRFSVILIYVTWSVSLSG
ncbi:hypothetical protein DL95DRAFT_391214 [Leptodontidium sp. 2 PMI_412]|nr:hypothetical protein DL95DRAFT_391214 [Leptodontidium sp. 2 PMI_412]